MRFGWHAKQASQRLMLFMVLTAIGLAVIYAVIYFLEPFSTFTNNLLVNVLTSTAAIFSASCATMIWVMYEKTDAPRRIWGFFAFGLWLWVIGEMTWGYRNMTLPNGEVPVGLSDSFWVVAYYFFAQALLLQYRLLVQPAKGELTRRVARYLIFFVIVFAAIFGVLIWLDISASAIDTLVNAFYPAGDITLALAAIWLTRNFQGGALGRPWIGLLVFTFTDLMYAWLQLSGTYAWSLDRGNLISGFSDIVYFSAYLVLGIGSFSQWLFLKYGLRSPYKAR